MKNVFILLLAFVYTYGPSLAFAGGPEGAGGHEKPKGLPQLDPSTYTSQIFWLLLVFGFLFFFFSKKSLPDIAQVLENRHDRIQNDLDNAQKLKDEVACVQKSYEDNLAQSRAEASALYKKIHDEMKAKTEAEIARFQEGSVQKIAGLEKNIEHARDAAINDMTRIASEVAVEASHRIIGVRPDINDAVAIVNSIHKTSKPAKAA
jgi:F-type H+-transporting ATPase subunit b